MISFLIISFAVWRLSSLLYDEDGPWLIFKQMRKWIKSHEHKGSLISDALKCFWCLSIWVALPFATYESEGRIYAFFTYTLAYSALAIVIDKVITKMEV